MNTNILFFFSTLGVLNGLILAYYFIVHAKSKHVSNYFLGTLFCILSIRVAKSVIFYFDTTISSQFIQIGLTACTLIGPFCYFYIKSVLKPASNISNTWIYHVSIIIVMAIFIGVVYPYVYFRALWKQIFLPILHLEWSVYLLLAGNLLYTTILKAIKNKKSLITIEIWMLHLYFGNLLILIGYVSVSYTSYIAGALSFSLLTYLLLLLLVFSNKKESVLFKKAAKHLQNKTINTTELQLLNDLQLILQTQNLFKNPTLTISDVADELKISSHHLSQLINDHLYKSFPHLINEYRIDYAKKMITENDEYTLEAIGNEAGFKSKSAFYNAFKKQVNTTPAKYKKAYLKK